MNNGIIQQNVVYKTDRGTPVTDSVKVAQVFGKQHKNVIQAIRNILGSAENSAHQKWFYESTYFDAQGKARPMYIMNRDGFSLLAMGLTGAKAMQFKVGFIEQFNAMEKVVKQVQQASPAIPQSFAEALRLAASQAEQIEQQKSRLKPKDRVCCFHKRLKPQNNRFLSGNWRKSFAKTVFRPGKSGCLLGCVKMATYVSMGNGTINRPKRQWKWGCLK